MGKPSCMTVRVCDRVVEIVKSGDRFPTLCGIMSVLTEEERVRVNKSRKSIQDFVRAVRQRLDKSMNYIAFGVTDVVYTGIPEIDRPPFTEQPPVNEYEVRMCLPGLSGRRKGESGTNVIAGLWVPRHRDGMFDELEKFYRGYYSRQGSRMTTIQILGAQKGIANRTLDGATIKEYLASNVSGPFVDVARASLEMMQKTIEGIGKTVRREIRRAEKKRAREGRPRLTVKPKLA